MSAGESNAGLRVGDKSKRGRIGTLLDLGPWTVRSPDEI
jgi:hypothetical protein